MLRRVVLKARRVVNDILLMALRADTAPRQYYKKVWNKLSVDEGLARHWVIGTDSREKFDSSARHDVEKLKNTVGLRDDDDVLEIGCGVGRVGNEIASICRSWTGCDVSANMLKFASERLDRFPNVSLVEISGYDLEPIPDSSRSVVYCMVVFMHLSEWDRFNYVAEAYRVLRPGGRVYIDNISLTTDYGWKFFNESRAIVPSERPPQIGSISTPQEFDVYLKRAGFKDTSTRIVDDAWVVGTGTK